MILIFDFCIQKQWILHTSIFLLFFIMVFIKLCLPIETKFSILIPLDKIMNPFLDFLQYRFHSLFMYQWLSILILIGILFNLIQFIKRILEYKYVINSIKKTGNRIEDKEYEIYQTSCVKTPMVIGIKGIILLPDNLGHKELEFALKHEIIHVQNKDNIIKCLFHILSILFWWFIPIHILRKQLDLFLELRVDKKVVQNQDENKKLDYLQYLIKTQKESISSSSTIVRSNLSLNRKSNLNYRVYSLLNKDKRRKSPLLIVSMIFLSCLIFTPYYTQTNLTQGTCEISRKNAYILINGGTRQLVVNMDGESIISPLIEYSLIKEDVKLNESHSLYIPQYSLNTHKNQIRWKYKDKNGQLCKRKYNAYKNSWESDWITYKKS